jgi:hypothetical protein
MISELNLSFTPTMAKGGQNTWYPIPEPELPEVSEPEIPDRNFR